MSTLHLVLSVTTLTPTTGKMNYILTDMGHSTVFCFKLSKSFGRRCYNTTNNQRKYSTTSHIASNLILGEFRNQDTRKFLSAAYANSTWKNLTLLPNHLLSLKQRTMLCQPGLYRKVSFWTMQACGIMITALFCISICSFCHHDQGTVSSPIFTFIIITALYLHLILL